MYFFLIRVSKEGMEMGIKYVWVCELIGRKIMGIGGCFRDSGTWERRVRE